MVRKVITRLINYKNNILYPLKSFQLFIEEEVTSFQAPEKQSTHDEIGP
jgi:hypothetical protein